MPRVSAAYPGVRLPCYLGAWEWAFILGGLRKHFSPAGLPLLLPVLYSSREAHPHPPGPALHSAPSAGCLGSMSRQKASRLAPPRQLVLLFSPVIFKSSHRTGHCYGPHRMRRSQRKEQRFFLFTVRYTGSDKARARPGRVEVGLPRHYRHQKVCYFSLISLKYSEICF